MNNLRIDYIDVEYNSTILLTGIVYYMDMPIINFERVDETRLMKRIMEKFEIKLIWNYLKDNNEGDIDENDVSGDNNSNGKLPARIY